MDSRVTDRATKARSREERTKKIKKASLHFFVFPSSLRAFVALLFIALFAGCDQDVAQVQRTILVPNDAKVVAEGTGQLKYRAFQDGRIFVYDVEDQLTDTARHVRAGQQVVVSPDQEDATLDGRKITEHALKQGHTHRVYFVPE